MEVISGSSEGNKEPGHVWSIANLGVVAIVGACAVTGINKESPWFRTSGDASRVVFIGAGAAFDWFIVFERASCGC